MKVKVLIGIVIFAVVTTLALFVAVQVRATRERHFAYGGLRPIIPELRTMATLSIDGQNLADARAKMLVSIRGSLDQITAVEKRLRFAGMYADPAYPPLQSILAALTTVRQRGETLRRDEQLILFANVQSNAAALLLILEK